MNHPVILLKLWVHRQINIWTQQCRHTKTTAVSISINIHLLLSPNTFLSARIVSLHKKRSFPLGISSVNLTNRQKTADLVTLTEEILSGKHFLCCFSQDTIYTKVSIYPLLSIRFDIFHVTSYIILFLYLKFLLSSQ